MTASPVSGKTTPQLVRHAYAKPPLVEAVLEIRIKPLALNALGTLKQLAEQESARYPTLETIFTGGLEIEFEATGSKRPRVSGSSEEFGVSVTSADKSELVQLRRNGISYHKLPPYSKWEDGFAETRRIWSKFASALPIGSIVQIGVRYINRLSLPAPCTLESYLRTYPEVSRSLSQVISTYVMQLSLPQKDLGNTVLVTRQALVSPPTPDVACVVLDNDLVMREELDPQSNELWDRLQLLHERQIEIFEASITDETRRLIA